MLLESDYGMVDEELPASLAGKEKYYDGEARRKRAARAARREQISGSTLSAPPLPAWPRYDSFFEDPINVGNSTRRKWAPSDRLRPDEWHSEIELYTNEIWKEQVAGIIEARIESFVPPQRSALPARPLVVRRKNQNTSCPASATTRALNIMELLEAILIAAGAGSQLVAYNVSRRWRDAAIFTIRSQVKSRRLCDEYPSSAVSYGDKVDDSLRWFQPSERELATFEDALVLAQRDVHDPSTSNPPVYFTARLTQALDLSEQMREMFNEFQEQQRQAIQDCVRPQVRRCEKAGIFSSQEIDDNLWMDAEPTEEPYWSDFSQFQLNPYLPGIFGGCSKENLGSLELTLNPTANGHPFLAEQSLSPPLLELLQSTYIMQPPCTSVSLFTWEPLLETYGHCRLSFLRNLHDEDGIRTGSLLSALDEVSDVVIQRWTAYAAQLRERVIAGHWKYDVWTVPGAPKIVILLSGDKIMSRDWEIHPLARESENPDYTDSYQWIQSVNREPRYVRQREWMPDNLMKPPRPQDQEQVAGNFPGMYHIAHCDDLFRESFKTDLDVRPLHRKTLERIRARIEELGWIVPFSWMDMPDAFSNLDLPGREEARAHRC